MLRFILPSLIWTAFVVVISLVPSSNVNLKEIQIEGVDKIAHFIMYTLMSLFWAIGLKRQNVSILLRRNAFKISVFGGFFLSLIIELIQEFVILTRHFEVLDLIANGIGCIFGIVLFKIIYQDYGSN
ncbi:VanZ family protein [Brumimicrobium sp.]|uniref:VanZ family protein n=1 Tax=Brumimicrobium sp. TaxID=2029867 RepID=UPI002607FA90|nr:VanZ family protein [uncultured Brumimicrobium sp.]